MTRADLKTGMFGKTNDNDWFVVVNDLLVYENGGFDEISMLTEDLMFESGYGICFLVWSHSFHHARSISNKSSRCIMSRSIPVRFRNKRMVELELGYEFVIEED